MYIPEYHRIKDQGRAIAFMRAYPFALLVSNSDQGPFATHLPIVVREHESELTLIGHVARANPHWELLQRGSVALVVFHGPHAYISPSLYESRESVPTWNYAAVHVYGRAKVFRDRERLAEILTETARVFDITYLEQWAALREEYRSGMLKHIVGFEITAEKVEGKFKLSQNRPKRDQTQIILSLEDSEESSARDIARLMKAQQLGF